MSKLIKVSSTSSTTISDDVDVTQVPTDNPHVRQRTIWIKAENLFRYINVSLIRRWKVLRSIPSIIDVTVHINGVAVKPSEKTDKYWIFDFPTLRSRWFDLLGNTSSECDLLALEELCMYKQLVAIGHYGQVPKELLKGALFTDDLTIVFIPQLKERAKQLPSSTKLEVIEEYFISDVHKSTYS